MKTILVIRSSAMGDVAMTAPVVDAVIKTYSDIRVVVLTREFFASFFQEDVRLDIFNIELHGRHKGIRGIRRLYKELCSQYEFDFVVDLHGKLYSKLLCLFFKISGVKIYPIDKGRKGKRELTRRKDKIKIQLPTTISAYSTTFARANLPVIIDEKLSSRRVIRALPEIFQPKLMEKWIGISPFAQHQGKRLDINIIKELIPQLLGKYPDAKIFIFGGGAQEAAIAKEIEAENKNIISVIGKIKLIEELNLMSHLDVMLSMDSSAMHLSSLVGLPVVSVWGATHYYAGFLGIGQSKDNVVEIEQLDCRPCSVYGNKPCYRGDYACLNQITAQMILAKIERVLNQN